MRSRILHLAVFFLLFIFQYAAAQVEPGAIIPGRMMVQLNDLNTLSSLTQSFNQYGFKIERILSHRLNIALLSYDEDSVLADDLLAQVRSFHSVILAQHDHVVQLRDNPEDSIPNDPFFGLQWSLYNTGQSGGVPGADIDDLPAWEITTGGLTAQGDTIVVAVIDGGCDISHPDLNLFKNWHEIPGNGIDDDGNGYSDDFHGWNAYNNTGNIPLSNHGTHVIGTVGAIGNNNIGITGVNQNVKVMPIAGASGIESTVVAAYAYAYDMRAFYDDTNGGYGAFIVSTNSSFGVDFGQPENYPIWGAMYDSMGTLGILSTAATANLNINIDVVGDVPTAFPSPYLISVTNTTNQDLKYSSAAYGLETIDLGAPGTQIYSTQNNNSYGYSTGTSMASPHVAGAVALLMAAADSSFIAYYKNNPAEAALQVKQFLLDGTDSLPSLQGITGTGGRLNVHNSIQLMINQSPNLYVKPDTINVAMLVSQELQTHITLYNTGGGAMAFEASIEGEPEWISLEPDSGTIMGGENLDILIDISTYGIEPGDYEAAIIIESDNGQQHTTIINLSVNRLLGDIENPVSSYIVRIGPNPFSQSTVFSIKSKTRESFHIQITDIQGRLIKEKPLSTLAGTNIEWQWNGYNLQGNACSNGIYFYRIIAESGIRTGKLILQR